MELRDDIRYYEVRSALPAKLIKTSREYKALAVLKYSFPDCFDKLLKLPIPQMGSVL